MVKPIKKEDRKSTMTRLRKNIRKPNLPLKKEERQAKMDRLRRNIRKPNLSLKTYGKVTRDNGIYYVSTRIGEAWYEKLEYLKALTAFTGKEYGLVLPFSYEGTRLTNNQFEIELTMLTGDINMKILAGETNKIQLNTLFNKFNSVNVKTPISVITVHSHPERKGQGYEPPSHYDLYVYAHAYPSTQINMVVTQRGLYVIDARNRFTRQQAEKLGEEWEKIQLQYLYLVQQDHGNLQVARHDEYMKKMTTFIKQYGMTLNWYPWDDLPKDIHVNFELPVRLRPLNVVMNNVSKNNVSKNNVSNMNVE